MIFPKTHLSYSIIITVVTLVLCSMVFSGCGGGGGGGGNGGGGSGQNIIYVSPSATASLSFDADPAALPSMLSVDYSQLTSPDIASFSSVFTFRGISFNLGRNFSTGSVSAVFAPGTTPLYRTIVAVYSISTGLFINNIQVFGVSSGSTGALNMIDVDPERGVLMVAASSRRKLIFIRSLDGVAQREAALSANPTVIKACPVLNRVLVALDGTPKLYAYSIDGTGSEPIEISLPAVPKAMAVNRVAGTAFVIFENSRTMESLNCDGSGRTDTSLDYLPQRIVDDNNSANRLFYAGGIGADKGVYKREPGGTQTRLFTVSELPEDIGYDGIRDQLTLVNYSNNTALVYSAPGGQLLRTVPVGSRPFEVRTADASGKAFVLNKGGDSVSVLNAASAGASTISLAADPVGMAADATNGKLYVLLNLWDISSAMPALLTASIRDGAGVVHNTSLNLTIRPVSTGGPGGPDTPAAPVTP